MNTNNQQAVTTLNMTDEELQASKIFTSANKLDPVQAVEDHFGQSYKTFNSDQELTLLGVAMNFNRHKEALLEAAGDSTFSMDAQPYMELVLSLGFELVWKEAVPMVSKGYGRRPDEVREEYFHVLAHRGLGVVLQWDTYTWGKDDGIEITVSRNSGDWFGVWKPNAENTHYSGHLSSGGWESLNHPNWRHASEFEVKNPDDLIWVGSWDAREGLKSKLRLCLEAGEFLTKWPSTIQQQHGLLRSHFDYYHPEYVAADKGGFSQFKVSDRLKAERKARMRADESIAWFFEMIGDQGQSEKEEM